jgi:hypothetical protein
MADAPQDLKNHRRFDPLWHYAGALIVLLGFIGAIVHAVRHPDRMLNWVGAVYALGVLLVVARARTQTLTVQDRLIRLEQRLRLKEALPPALAARINELTVKQLVGLRFASDAEVSGLVERCLNGQLNDGEAVKKEIKNWQADWLRA